MDSARRVRPAYAAVQAIERDIGMEPVGTGADMLSAAEESRTDLGGAHRALRTIAVRSPEGTASDKELLQHASEFRGLIVMHHVAGLRDPHLGEVTEGRAALGQVFFAALEPLAHPFAVSPDP